MNKKLIAIDLDGTTLNAKSVITDETKETVRNLRKQGHIVSISTGRPYRTSYYYYKDLDLDSPIVNFNGAWCHNPTDYNWEKTYHRGLDRELALNLLQFEKNEDIQLISAETKETLYTNGDYIPYPEFFPEGSKNSKFFSEENLLEDPTAVNVFTNNKLLQPKIEEEIINIFGDSVEVRTWGGFAPCLEIVSAGVQKAMGVEQIADYYDIKPKDILAFGDEDNDYEMIQYAGHGVVMKNGIKELKDISNDVTDFTNDENGLAKYLQEYFKI